MGPLGPKSEPAGGRKFQKLHQNWGFWAPWGPLGPLGGGFPSPVTVVWCPFSKISQKLAFLAFLGSKMVVLGSKMVVPSSVTGHGALPSANTSPELGSTWAQWLERAHKPKKVDLRGEQTGEISGRWNRCPGWLLSPALPPNTSCLICSQWPCTHPVTPRLKTRLQSNARPCYTVWVCLWRLIRGLL